MSRETPDSLILVWQLAELEARRMGAANIDPVHLLLALCKAVDLDLAGLVQKSAPQRHAVLEELLREVRRLRTVFEAAGLNARKFRRALRKHLGEAPARVPGTETLHRSKEARQIFALAEQSAATAGSPVYPAHLLAATVSTPDPQRDKILVQLHVDPAILMELSRRETALPWIDGKPHPGLN